jgi:ABC-type dipeptide/oligopeptide/nickel transport system permease subunit
MKVVHKAAIVVVALVALASLAADILAPHDYTTQFRDHAGEPPSRAFPMGTDDLGRDRMSRLIYGTRVSVLLAPATAFAATGIAAALGLAAGWRRGALDSAITVVTDLFLSLPWLFLLLTLRALLPLNISAVASLVVMALLLAGVGWAAGTRVVRASVFTIRDSPHVVHARAYGCSTRRLLLVHVLPNLRPVLAAQFWILVPAFLIVEANLGVLGLGVNEPMPSLGNLMVELREYQRIPGAPWILAPAAVLVALVASLHVLVTGVPTCE